MRAFQLAVLVSGGGTNLQAIMDSITNGFLKNVEICAVISNHAKAYALERAAAFSNQIKTAVITSRDLQHNLLPYLKECSPDLIVLAGFLAVIPDSVIDEYEGRIINIHPSLIPSFCGRGYYGLHVHETVLARGVKITGATVHEVDKGIDTGKILAQKAVEVMPDDTPERLQKRVMQEAEWVLLPQVIRQLAQLKYLEE